MGSLNKTNCCVAVSLCAIYSMSLSVFCAVCCVSFKSLHPKIQVTKPTRAREHFKEFWKAKLLFIFIFVAFVSLTSEVWDVEIKKHLGLKQFAIMHGANRFFGLVNVEGFETTLCTHTYSSAKKNKKKKKKKKKKERWSEGGEGGWTEGVLC